MPTAPAALLLLALAPPVPAAPAAGEGASSGLEPGLAALLAGPLPQRGLERSWGPDYVIAIGAHWVDGDYDAPQDADSEEDPAFSIEFVAYNWSEERGIGLELGLMSSSYDVDVTAIETETVDTWRALIGVRLADRGPTDTFWIPYLRGGLMYRTDSGDVIDDDGYGWYLGGGIDFRLGGPFAITPQVLFSDTTSLNSQEWIAGVLLSFVF
jgi:hypothetical protein